MKIKTMYLGPLVCSVLIAGIATPSTANASGTEELDQLCPVTVRSVDNSPDPIEINGIIFGPEQGLQLEEFKTEFIECSNQASLVQPFGYNWTYTDRITRGSSYVQNHEQTYLVSYFGTARAGGNVYSGKRIIQASITYKRDGKVKGSATSNAIYRSGWQSGEPRTVHIWENSLPGAAQTEWFYSFYSVDPNLTG